MGVRQLNTLVKKLSPASVTTYTSLRPFAGKRLAIDANLLTTKFHYAGAGVQTPQGVAVPESDGHRHARAWYYFLEALKKEDILPFVVFDGSTRVKAKDRENALRRKERELQRLRAAAEGDRGERLRAIRAAWSQVEPDDRPAVVEGFKSAVQQVARSPEARRDVVEVVAILEQFSLSEQLDVVDTPLPPWTAPEPVEAPEPSSYDSPRAVSAVKPSRAEVVPAAPEPITPLESAAASLDVSHDVTLPSVAPEEPSGAAPGPHASCEQTVDLELFAQQAEAEPVADDVGAVPGGREASAVDEPESLTMPRMPNVPSSSHALPRPFESPTLTDGALGERRSALDTVALSDAAEALENDAAEGTPASFTLQQTSQITSITGSDAITMHVATLVALYEAYEDDMSNPVYSRNQAVVTSDEGAFFRSILRTGAGVDVEEGSYEEPALARDDVELDDIIAQSDKLGASHTKRSDAVPGAAFREVRNLVVASGLPFLEPSPADPHEAEGVCSALYALGLVDYVVSEDTDVAVYGAPLLRRITVTPAGTGRAAKEPMNVLDPVQLRGDLGLSREEFVDFALLCGTDFTERIPGIGPVNALKLIQQHSTIEAVLATSAGRFAPVGGDVAAYLETVRDARAIFLSVPNLPLPEASILPDAVTDPATLATTAAATSTFLGSLTPSAPSPALPTLLRSYGILRSPSSDEQEVELDEALRVELDDDADGDEEGEPAELDLVGDAATREEFERQFFA